MKRASCVTLLRTTNRKPHSRQFGTGCLVSSDGFGVLSQFREFNELTTSGCLILRLNCLPSAPAFLSSVGWLPHFKKNLPPYFNCSLRSGCFLNNRCCTKRTRSHLRVSLFFLLVRTLSLSLSLLFVIPCAARCE